jgi:myo-inositol-1(or 4)-monophosphatase
MDIMNLNLEMNVVKSAVRQAGTAIMRIAEEHYAKAARADRSIVTLADIEADKILRQALTSKFNDYGWLSEETAGLTDRFDCKRVWIVDPIDGTREFVMKNPEFVVSVALVEDGRPILGVIYNPSTDDMYEATIGQGTKLNGVIVKADHKLNGNPVVEVSSSDVEKGRFSHWESLVKLQPCGSIAYKLARLAAGTCDSTLSITPKNEWDIAAGIILVKEAGGKVTDLSGNDYVFNQKDTLVNGVVAATLETYGIIKKIFDATKN